MSTQSIINIIKKQIQGFTLLQFHAYWVNHFIAKNNETGAEIMAFMNVNNIDSLYRQFNNL